MLLEVGMNIYCTGGFDRSINKYKITRVTEKRAFLNVNERCEIAFKREVGDGSYFCPIGSDKWSVTSYRVETPELIEKYKRQLLEIKVEKIKVKELTNAQLQRILEIINEPEQLT